MHYKIFIISSGNSKKKRRNEVKQEKKEGRNLKSRANGRNLPHQASRAAERAATSARPAGPSEESCRNKCRRDKRMLRAKRASSPAEQGLPAAALTSEQRSSTVQGLELLICRAVQKQKRERAAAKCGHSQNACHSES